MIPQAPPSCTEFNCHAWTWCLKISSYFEIRAETIVSFQRFSLGDQLVIVAHSARTHGVYIFVTYCPVCWIIMNNYSKALKLVQKTGYKEGRKIVLFPSYSMCYKENKQGEGYGNSSFDKMQAVPGWRLESGLRTHIKSWVSFHKFITPALGSQRLAHHWNFLASPPT